MRPKQGVFVHNTGVEVWKCRSVEITKCGNKRDSSVWKAGNVRVRGFYLHDVQATAGTGFSKTIMNSPTAKRLKAQGLQIGADIRVWFLALIKP